MSRSAERFTFVRCRRCSLVYLSPRVPARSLDRFYGPDYLPHRGEAAWGRWAPLARRGQELTDRARVRWARRAAREAGAPLGAGSAVLDVGCGRPTFLEALARVTGARAVGVDTSDAGWAAEPGRWAAAGLELHRGEPGDALFGGLAGPFDLVTLWHALEHDYAPLDTLRRLHRLTRPGGTLVVEVPDWNSLTRRLQGPAWAGLHTPRHTAVYTRRTLRAMLGRAGWRVAAQHRHGTLDPYVLWWLGRQERRGRPLDGSLEAAFVPFMAGKVAALPLAALQRWLRLGVQLAIATK